jgi:glycosyltransferase involved in cell wall biosynthesis
MRKIFILLEKFGADLSDKLITVTHTIISKALKVDIGSKEKYKMIRSGFDINKFMNSSDSRNEIRKKMGIKENDIVVGKIARFSKLKGHKYIIDIIPEVVKKIPNVKFLFVGSGELENIFKEEVKKNNVERYVIFAGLINIDEIPEIINAIDLIVHTSLLEGLARVLPQSLAAGKPAISFDIDGAHEVVINDKTGYLVEPKNSDKLAKAIIEILTNSQKAELFGKNGRCLVEQEWTISQMVNEIDNTYKELILAKKL